MFPRRGHRTMPHISANHHILKDRKSGEGLHDLKGPGQPANADDIWRQSGDAFAVEDNLSRGGSVKPGNQGKGCRFSRSIRAYKSKNAPSLYSETEVQRRRAARQNSVSDR